MSRFKVLFIYPNGTLMNPPPIAIGLFTALLRQEGIETDLFDTTFYIDETAFASDDAKEQFLQARPVDDRARKSKLRTTRMEDDIVKKVDEYRPDLIMVSALEITFPPAVRLLEAIKDCDVPVLAGGVLAYSATHLVLKNDNIDYACIGEGEGLVVDICRRMAAGQPIWDIPNLAYKKDGKIVKNPMRRLEDINQQPTPDYSLFEPERFLRPMGGRVYRTVSIETNRGCPYKCTFCNSPYTLNLYADTGDLGFFRKKSAQAIGRELSELIARHDAEYVYFTSDTFILFTDKEFEEFCTMYSEFKLPFWIQTRSETITEYRIQRLAELGCHRMSIGLEHGNEEFRKKMVHKRFDNVDMIAASKMVEEAGIPLTVNNIIGFPDETREMIFDTIRLNRSVTFDSVNVSPFAPFHGTDLHKLCVENGLIEPDHVPGSLMSDFALDQPQLSRKEVLGLRRTFPLYVRLPEEEWPLIERAEQDTEEGNRAFESLRQRYQRTYFGSGVDDDASQC